MLYQVLIAMRCTREVPERANTTNTTAADIWLRVRIGFHTSPPHARKKNPRERTRNHSSLYNSHINFHRCQVYVIQVDKNRYTQRKRVTSANAFMIMMFFCRQQLRLQLFCCSWCEGETSYQSRGRNGLLLLEAESACSIERPKRPAPF